MKEKTHKPPAPLKRAPKKDREKQVLLGLVETYLKTGKPVGSGTLKDAGFEGLSSATIRNYFAKLEEEGYLKQLHSSGGRIPTERAYRYYAEEALEHPELDPANEARLSELGQIETRIIAAYMQKAAEWLSAVSNTAVFISAPRFDHDFIRDMRLVSIDENRVLCVLVTDFGVVKTELLPVEQKLSAFTLKRIESYFHWRLTGRDKPQNLPEDEELLAPNLYNEALVRFIANYSNFSEEDILKTGFSRLLNATDVEAHPSLAGNLALFENSHNLRLLLRECAKMHKIRFWIGQDLAPFSKEPLNCSILTAPYHINQSVVGAVGLMGPFRIPYRELFGLLKAFTGSISKAMTNSLYKFKIQYRKPLDHYLVDQHAKEHVLEHSQLIMLEDKRG
jgi:heat-inducible transcriptional repressor